MSMPVVRKCGAKRNAAQIEVRAERGRPRLPSVRRPMVAKNARHCPTGGSHCELRRQECLAEPVFRERGDESPHQSEPRRATSYEAGRLARARESGPRAAVAAWAFLPI